MLITAIQIRRIDNSGNKLIGIASITLDDMIAIHDIKVLKNSTGLFLAMPSRKSNTGTFKDIVHPISSNVRKAVERLIFHGIELADTYNLYSLELKANNLDANSLLEQDADDFFEGNKIYSQLVNKSDGNGNFSQTHAEANSYDIKPDREKNSVDILQKWLES